MIENFEHLQRFCIWVCILIICQKSQNEVSNDFAFGDCILGNLANERANRGRLSKSPMARVSRSPARSGLFFAPYILHGSRQQPPALHAPPSAADRSRERLHRKHRPSTRRRSLLIVTDSIAQKLAPHAPPSTAAIQLVVIQLAAWVPGRAKKSTTREGTATAHHTEKNSHPGPLCLNAKSIM